MPAAANEMWRGRCGAASADVLTLATRHAESAIIVAECLASDEKQFTLLHLLIFGLRME
jgi:hypothetical protein